MKSFHGIVMKKGHRADANLLKALPCASDDSRSWAQFSYLHFAFAVSSAKGRDKLKALNYEDAHYAFSLIGRLDLPVELSENEQPKDIRDLVRVISEKPAVLRGEFALLLLDKQREKLVLIRDQMGTVPLFYFEGKDYLAFSSELFSIRSLADSATVIDDIWIADSLSGLQSEKWRSPYQDVLRLEPGFLLEYSEEKKICQYWDLCVREAYAKIDYASAVSAFRESLEKSIKNRLRYQGAYAAELSGGLDSAGITAMGIREAKESGSYFCALTHAFSDASLGKYFPYQDERNYSLKLARHIGLSDHFMCNGDGYGLVNTLKANILHQAGPTQQAYSLFSDTLYENARKHGVTLLLSGFGGDEGVSSKATRFFEEVAEAGNWDLFLSEAIMQAKLKGSSVFRARLRYIQSRYLPRLKVLREEGNRRHNWPELRYKSLGFSDEFEERMALKDRYAKRIRAHSSPDLRIGQYGRLMHEHVSQRLEYSYFDAARYGITYAYPLLDVDLLELYYSLPAHYKFREGYGRALFREAMKGLLPEEIRLRKDKSGATIPTVYQRFVEDREAIGDLIKRSSEKNHYHYLDCARMSDWHRRLLAYSKDDKLPLNLPAFFNSLQILLLQEMERSGEFNSGIKV